MADPKPTINSVQDDRIAALEASVKTLEERVTTLEDTGVPVNAPELLDKLHRQVFGVPASSEQSLHD